MKDCKLKRFLIRNYEAYLRFSSQIKRVCTDFYIKLHPISKTKIVLDNYGGQGYGDNAKYIVDEIHRQNLPWDIVWLTKDMSAKFPAYVRPVRYGSEKARRELATAKVVVYNKRDSMRTPKRQGQLFIQTWHGGMGFKKVEAAVEDKLGSYYLACAKRDGAECDAIVSSCAYQTEDFVENFWLNEKTEILEVGQPRCDGLFSADEACIKEKIRQKLMIPKEKSIVLYAPTFRDEKTVSCFALDFEGILATLKQTTNNDYVIVVRLHPNVQHLCSFLQYNDHIINGSTYPDIQELYVASDVLITDYSSAAFDFALLDKPVFLCMLDYEDYLNLRGLSDTFESCPFSKAYSNAEMIQVLERFSLDEYQERLHHYKQTFWKPFEDGHSAERVVNWLKKQIRQ